MKKLIAMVMTAAMVASLVPATAFAGDSIDATAKVVNSWTKKDTHKNLDVSGNDVPELQLKLTDVGAQGTDPTKSVEFTITLDNADFADADDLEDTVRVTSKDAGAASTKGSQKTTYSYEIMDKDDIEAALKDYYNGNDLKSESPNGPDGTFVKYGTITAGTVPTDTASFDSNLKPFVFSSARGLKSVQTTTAKENGENAAKAYVTAKYNDFVASGGLTNGQSVAKAEAGVNDNGEKIFTVTDDHSSSPKSVKVPESDVIAWVQESGTAEMKKTLENGKFKETKDVEEKDFITDSYAGLTASTPTAGSLNNEDLYKATAVVETEITGEAKGGGRVFTYDVKALDDDEIKLTVKVTDGRFEEGDVISMDLLSTLDKTKNAYVSVDSDDINITNGDDLLYVAIEDEGVTASIKKVATVAEEEHTTLEKNLVIKSTVEDFAPNQIIELKLNNGFEFVKSKVNGNSVAGEYSLEYKDDDMVELTVLGDAKGDGADKIEVLAEHITIEATDAKAGATCTMTVKATNNVNGAFSAKTTVEVMKVVEYTVVMSVDEDEDVPVIYSGVDVDNTGITDDSDHYSLEVTIEESFPGAWSFRKGFDLELPEHVYVTGVDVTDVDNLYQTDADGSVTTIGKDELDEIFEDAYQDGDHVNFEFDKRVFDDVNNELNDEEATISFKLELVADPGFAGDVTLKFTGDLVDEQEVTVATFVAPYTVKAEQNDLIIDYRYTEVPTEITVTEAEAGLWDKDEAKFAVYVDKHDYIVFEDDPTFTVDKNSGLELDDEGLKKGNWDGESANDNFEAIYFVVDKESDEAATVTISDLSLFMQRSIPAGAYDLMGWTSMAQKYEAQQLYAAETCTCADYSTHVNSTTCDAVKYVHDVCDYSDTVKEAFVNVVTAGRDQDDASFTTKVVVPVGENKITAGEVEYTIDAPAYINANGYTMLPVRAVATALGIKNDNVLWDQATKTVTILYGQRIITMQVGASVVYVNGAAIPASSSVEITNSRTFLGLRDLATALGVTDITWDASTKTATLNGGNTAE